MDKLENTTGSSLNDKSLSKFRLASASKSKHKFVNDNNKKLKMVYFGSFLMDFFCLFMLYSNLKDFNHKFSKFPAYWGVKNNAEKSGCEVLKSIFAIDLSERI